MVRHQTRDRVAVAFGLVLLVVMAANFAVISLSADPVLDPLGPYPTQHVTNRVPGVDGPAARYGETMLIEGELCNSLDRDVDVLTSLSWQAVGHTGTFVAIAIDIPQTRKAGCETFSVATGNPFTNPMPETVVEATKALGGTATWRVVGFEVPILDDGAFGTRAVFESEPFQVVP